MSISRFTRAWFLLLAGLAVLVGGALPLLPVQASQVSRHANSGTLFALTPRWHDAVRLTHGSLSLPTCLSRAQPDRCYSPTQIGQAYGFASLWANGLDGTGTRVVLIELSYSSTLRSDVQQYDRLFGLPSASLTLLQPFGAATSTTTNDLETALDVETVHSLAPAAAIDVVTTNTKNTWTLSQMLTHLLTATSYAVTHNLGDIISMSFGLGESCTDNAYRQQARTTYSQARAKGITLLASTGDYGALVFGCKSKQLVLEQGVDMPASDPQVTAVGGTTLSAAKGSGNYQGEAAWNNGTDTFSATGGGYSTVYARPGYQQGFTSNAKRSIPDVAFEADPHTGIPVVITIGGTTEIVPVGGTSYSAPAWAALTALADQFVGGRLGFLNPRLYGLAQTPGAAQTFFHDIRSGNNTIKFTDKKKLQTIPGYAAQTGWDAVTGLGSPRADNLIPAL